MENLKTQSDITIADLDLIRNILDLASSRGAFRGGELTQVGAIYDKLHAFLEVIVAQAQEAQAQEAQAQADSQPVEQTGSVNDQTQGE